MHRHDRRFPAGTGIIRLAAVTVASVVMVAAAAVAGVPAAADPAGPPAAAVAPDQRALDESQATSPGCGAAPNATATLYATCFAMVYTPAGNQAVPDAATPPSSALGPADIRSAYNLPSDTAGTGETVAIVDAYGDSHAEDDLAQFRAQYGLTPCTTGNGCFRKVDQNGGTDYPADNVGWGVETSLDLDAVSAACPNCTILLVQTDDNEFENLGAGVGTAVALGARFVSNSYGLAGEFAAETTFDHFYDHPGIAITVASGDEGGVPYWPASSPGVVSVGGTTLVRTPATSRGWTEVAWAGSGAGCSQYEPHQDFQDAIATGCANRATADIAADANPGTGLAVYDTLGEAGWMQVGGTSLAAPLVAGMYALAGPPVPDTLPVTYPYQDSADLNDITVGTAGACGTVLCVAGPGWDGPTGLGTPDGVAALTTGPHGEIAGTVTDATTGAPLAGATVSTSAGNATADPAGRYELAVPVGTYDVAAQAFGYKAKTSAGVSITENTTTTVDFTMKPLPSYTLSGSVTDGSGHGWPLYAKLSIAGYPGAVYTDPFTGHYSVQLPRGFAAAVHVEPALPGYQPIDATLKIAGADKVKDFKAKVAAETCTTPGYAFKYTGTGANFTGWTGTTPQDGWTNVDNEGNGEVWSFDNTHNRPLPPGSDGDVAILDSDGYGYPNQQDASLVSPVADLKNVADPQIQFDTYYAAYSTSTADVDLSLDGGSTWSTVWESTTVEVVGPVTIPIPQAAGVSTVRIRFRYTALFGFWWAIDNVILGTRTCAPSHGGLVAGLVSDANTGAGLDGAVVNAADGTSQAVAAATPADAGLADGFYWLFSPVTGDEGFSTTDGRYVTGQATPSIQPNYVTRQDFRLAAGDLAVTPASVSLSERLGATKKTNLRLTNDGTAPIHVELSEQAGSATLLDAAAGTRPATPVVTADPGTPAAIGALYRPGGAATAGGGRPRTAVPADAPWAGIADYPQTVLDNAAAYDGNGKVYSVGGYNGASDVDSAYVYDTAGGQWSAIASAPVVVEQAAAAFVDGKLYLAGGWVGGFASTGVFAYDPATDTWTRVASLPNPISATGVAVLDDKIYLVGGCTTGACAPSSTAVLRYDPQADTWSSVADYPQPVSFVSCAGVLAELVCAGGVDASTARSSAATYIYNPGANAWVSGADMPMPLWGSAYSGANGRLQVATGTSGSGETNAAFEYDAASNSWSDLPPANNAVYRSAGACGMYQIGGGNSVELGVFPVPFAEVLPGYDVCGTVDVPWLSEDGTAFDLAPGASVKVSVSTDSSVVGQPGTYTAKLGISTDSPYLIPAVDVTMTANPPASWGKITGTVTDAETGVPLAGATVHIATQGGAGTAGYTLTTDTTGHYQLWLDANLNPLLVDVELAGYEPQERKVRVTRGSTVIEDFALDAA